MYDYQYHTMANLPAVRLQAAAHGLPLKAREKKSEIDPWPLAQNTPLHVRHRAKQVQIRAQMPALALKAPPTKLRMRFPIEWQRIKEEAKP